MKEIIVNENEAGQRLDKLLGKYLNKAPKSFLYKMLRKKNITLNGKKAAGNEQTVKGDVVKIFLADDTYEKFSEQKVVPVTGNRATRGTKSDAYAEQQYELLPEQIIYEDHHIIIINKPAGVLSQKAKPADVSMNEMLLTYLLKKGELTETELQTFRPSICNRLDRNTSGLLIAGKTLAGLQTMSEVLRDRSLHKYYRCLVAGQIMNSQRIEGYLWKDTDTNKVLILKEEKQDAKPIVTEYSPVRVGQYATHLEVLLITGRSHQIRAHLSSIGCPIIGDTKYGREKTNKYYKKKYGLHHQLLHSYRMELPKIEGALSYLSGKTFTAPLPAIMDEIMKGN